MAKIKFGATVTGVRGTIGGITFSSNGSTNYARIWRGGTNPRSVGQNIPRMIMGQLPAFWRALSSAQKLAWCTWAALPAQARTNSLGVTYYPSGWNQFYLVNARLIAAARSYSTSVPTSAVPAAPSLTALNAYTGASNDTEITFAGTPFAGVDLIISGAIHSGEGVQAKTHNLLKIITDDRNPSSPFSFQSECEDAFGNLSVGTHLFVGVSVQTTDGQRSSGTYLNDAVTVS